MPVGPYNTRASNSQWNPGLPDMSEKTRLNFVNLLAARDHPSSKRQAASSSTRRTGDPEPNNVATGSSRPQPRPIFNKNKLTGKYYSYYRVPLSN